MALRPKVNLVVLDPGSGKARPGAWVTFYHSNTLDKPTLFADDDVSTVPNPVQANGLGQVAVRIATGVYDVSMSFDGASPTVVEDVLAWTPEADVITSPGDLIIGGPNGEPIKLAVGANGQVLLVENGMPVWKTLAGGAGLPLGSPGSILSYGANQAVSAILPGVQDQALVMQGGIPSWASILTAGQVLPINQPGDLVVGSVPSGLPTRLARGNPGDTLVVNDAGGLQWQAGGEVARGVGECYLQYYSGDDLRLIPWEGNQIWVGGKSRTIPDAGVSVSKAGLTPLVTYYLYAAWSGAALVIEASTQPSTTTGGLAHKIGDTSRTLVGMVILNEPGVWADLTRQRHVLSYFNDSGKVCEGHLTTTVSVTSTDIVEASNAIRCSFLAWGWESVNIALDGIMTCPFFPSAASSYLVMDNVIHTGIYWAHPGGTNDPFNFNIAQNRTVHPMAGWHLLTMWVETFTGAAHQWFGDPNNIIACRTHALIPA